MIPKVEEMYKMDGEMKSFSVRSNTPFTVSVKQETNANNVISQLSTSGEANTSEQGTAVKFKIIDDITNPIVLQREVKVTISSPENLFDDYDVTLKCKSAVVQPESNSYIVAPDGLGILIPVSRANRSKMGNQVVATTSLTADLVWTDNLNGLAANSNIKSIKITGSGSDRYLYVTPGTAPGNALVAIKSGNKILWSWHIWVTNYNPLPIGTGKFMDRNLGAISNTPGAIATRGFLYQWGRKDPFQGSQTLYNASGDAIEEVSIEIYSSISKSYFNDSFANPTLLYSYRYGTRDWIGTGVGFRDDNLWSRSNSQKTIYDPCPPGWRVPELTIWNGLNNSNFSWDATNKGRTNAGYGGYYPAAGYRSAGNNENVGTQGYCWSTSISSGGFFGSNEGYSFGLSFTSNSVSVAQDNRSRSDALSVRCVKE